MSHALVEMADILITPRNEDFDNINSEAIKDIYSHATTSESVFNTLVNYLKNC